MCGIAGIFNIKIQSRELRNKALRMARKIRHRGPDWSGMYCGGSAILAHERLSIVDPQSGGQPLYSSDRKQVLAVNGEIYNHRDIRAQYAGRYEFRTGSDCEVILALYRDKGIHFLEELNGIFAFALYDEEKDEYLIARDPIGVIPLYIGKDAEGHVYFGSELKALEGFCDEYEPFLPGHYYHSKEGTMKRWYTRDWMEYKEENDKQADSRSPTRQIQDALENAVHRQLMSDVPYGVLLSGGLDSSLALLVTVRAFQALGKDPKDIVAVTMPCFGTTDKTLQNSLKLMEALGVTSRIVPVKDAVLQHFKDISHDENNKNTAYENAQARMRTLVLMDIANDANGIVIGTGDLSELALGWATYNGDHMSMYGVNASVPKTLVRHLIAYEGKRLGGAAGAVLEDILHTEISPELLPPEDGKIAQKTEELVGPYELHDFYLYHAVRWGFPPEKVLYLAKAAFKEKYSDDTLRKWLKNFYRRFFSQQFKRSCLPDGVKIGSVSLSPRGDWRMPSDAESRLWLEKLEEKP